MSIKNNEFVYDEQINPLMAKIIAICREHKIPMAATFEYAPGDFCSTLLPFDGMADLMERVNRVISNAIPPSPLQITTTKADGSKIIEVIIP